MSVVVLIIAIVVMCGLAGRVEAQDKSDGQPVTAAGFATVARGMSYAIVALLLLAFLAIACGMAIVQNVEQGF